MPSRRFSQFCIAFTLSIASCLALCDSCAANYPVRKAPQEARHVYVLLVIDDTDPKLAKARAADAEHLQAFFATALPQGVCDTTLLRGSAATMERINDFLGSLPPGLPRATLVCYVCAAGGCNYSQGSFLRLGPQTVWRDALFQRMKQKQAQLTVLLSDCYSEVLPISPARLQALANSRPNKHWAKTDSAQASTEAAKQAVADLLLRSEGEVDFSTAANQPSFADPKIGGYFTAAFVRACTYPFRIEPEGPPFPPKSRDEKEAIDRMLLKAKKVYGPPTAVDIVPTWDNSYSDNLLPFSGGQIDRNGDGFVSWLEFLEFNWKAHLALLHGQICYLPVEAPLHPEPPAAEISHDKKAPEPMRFLYGFAKARIMKTGGSFGIGRTYVVCPDERAVRNYLEHLSAIGPDLRVARSEEHAHKQLEREFEMNTIDYRLDQTTLDCQFRWLPNASPPTLMLEVRPRP